MELTRCLDNRDSINLFLHNNLFRHYLTTAVYSLLGTQNEETDEEQYSDEEDEFDDDSLRFAD